MIVLEIVSVILALMVSAVVFLLIRRRMLLRNGGAIDMGLRLCTKSPGRGWVLGIGRYVGDHLLWYRSISISYRPTRVLSRRDLQVIRRRSPDFAESWAIQHHPMIIECRTRDESVQLAFSEDAVNGFLSWLESLPPGYRVPGFLAS